LFLPTVLPLLLLLNPSDRYEEVVVAVELGVCAGRRGGRSTFPASVDTPTEVGCLVISGSSVVGAVVGFLVGVLVGGVVGSRVGICVVGVLVGSGEGFTEGGPEDGATVARLLTCAAPALLEEDASEGLVNPMLKFGISSMFCNNQIANSIAACGAPGGLVEGISAVGSTS
jgi:hypothetical protein